MVQSHVPRVVWGQLLPQCKPCKLIIICHVMHIWSIQLVGASEA